VGKSNKCLLTWLLQTIRVGTKDRRITQHNFLSVPSRGFGWHTRPINYPESYQGAKSVSTLAHLAGSMQALAPSLRLHAVLVDLRVRENWQRVISRHQISTGLPLWRGYRFWKNPWWRGDQYARFWRMRQSRKFCSAILLRVLLLGRAGGRDKFKITERGSDAKPSTSRKRTLRSSIVKGFGYAKKRGTLSRNGYVVQLGTSCLQASTRNISVG